MTERPLRADARRSREAIVAAFAELVQEGGGDVLMSTVARRAGVGQATLYRHFPDLAALTEALFELAVDEMEQVAAGEPDDPELVLRMLVAATDGQARMHRLSAALVVDPQSEVTARLEARNLRLFAAPFQRGLDAGVLRPGATLHDVTVVMSMVEGVLSGIGTDEQRATDARRGVRIAIAGLVGPAASQKWTTLSG